MLAHIDHKPSSKLGPCYRAGVRFPPIKEEAPGPLYSWPTFIDKLNSKPTSTREFLNRRAFNNVEPIFPNIPGPGKIIVLI